MLEILPIDIVQHVHDHILISKATSPWDLSWWMFTTSGKFIVANAFQLIR